MKHDGQWELLFSVAQVPEPQPMNRSWKAQVVIYLRYVHSAEVFVPTLSLPLSSYTILLSEVPIKIEKSSP